MKVVIFAGGLGTRISEESHLRPKPMIEIGEKPIIWHIMKYYSHYGFNDFIICMGYKAQVIREFFANYYLHMSDITFDFRNGNQTIIHENVAEPWKVTLVDTGLNTQTGGRLSRVEKYLDNEPFMLTYGDGVSDVDLNKLLEFHKASGKTLTLTAIQPGARFGVLDIEEETSIIKNFNEKSKEDGGWINGGFMVVEPEIFELLDDNTGPFEVEPMNSLVNKNELNAFKHNGFWQCMDTQRDKMMLDSLWDAEKAPWKKW